MNPAFAELFFKELLKIERSVQPDWRQKSHALEVLIQKIFLAVTEEERIQFNNLFARLSYACQRYEVDKRTQFQLHGFRRLLRVHSEEPGYADWQDLFRFGWKVVASVIAGLWKVSIPAEVKAHFPETEKIRLTPPEVVDYRANMRVVAIKDDPDRELLLCQDVDSGAEVQVRYNLPERNENFQPSIRALRSVFGFPVTLQLLDVEVDAAGQLRPIALVVEPDFLVDVTSIAECFQSGGGTEPMLYLLKKFLPFESSESLLVGNIANYFLDELIARPDADFRELFKKVFRLNPLQFAAMTDREVSDIMAKCQRHYEVIRLMVLRNFRESGIDLSRCYLEPSFLSEMYGIQGRLDVFHYPGAEKGKSAIVELKSGKPFMPNLYGLSNNHFTQTLLYDLLVKSAYGKSLDPANFILYSSMPEKPLRYAPAVRAQQMEALQVRNQLVAMEWQLANWTLGTPEAPLSHRLRTDHFPDLKGFPRRDLEAYETMYSGLTPLEQKYFDAFAGFIAREHRLAKMGIQGVESANGMASLWLDSLDEKESKFEIIRHLRIHENAAQQAEPLIVFEKTDKTNPLANFRQGDIAALYPAGRTSDTVLKSQVFKVTIVELGKDTITVRLRSRQSNLRVFEENAWWNLEHDLLDSSFVGMYRGLFEFGRSQSEKKALLLTQRAPDQPKPHPAAALEEMTPEQQVIFQKILGSQEYFLLWGPPGTGKTSVMVKHLVGHWLQHTEENLLLLAYTNRAVDEICEAIENLGDYLRETYVRIGSRYSTDPRYHNQLLDRKIESVSKRSELLDVIASHRIFVATVSSFQSRGELVKLKKFDRVIIDEASQILEPMLVGLLPMFEHFTLIGDHRQLPAVVVQDERASAIRDRELQALGLTNMRNSLFERLFLRCEQEGWNWAYDKLSHQGRMHRDIMAFPNAFFYGGLLKLLPEGISGREQQVSDLPATQHSSAEPNLGHLLSQKRVLFLPTEADEEDGLLKTNRHEAAMVVRLVRHFREHFGEHFNRSSLGVITPYRAQIALIRKALQDKGLDPEALTIDTVERYQGGARDVILISLCTNNDSQLSSLSSLSHEGIDRKLNVALTRARQHLVIVGNPELLQANPVYSKLLDWYLEKNGNNPG
jgi:DNA replication ATP-dependent helicase Dna2